MNSIIRFLYFFLMFVMIVESANAQSGRRVQRLFEEARQAHAMHDYAQAQEKCGRILDMDSTYIDAHLLLADIYQEQGLVRQEVFHLQKARQLSNRILILYRLGVAYLSIGEYMKSLEAFESFMDSENKGTVRYEDSKRKSETCRFAIQAKKNPVDFKPERLPDAINSVDDEYWPGLSVDQKQMIFTRLVKNPNQQPQEDFYYSELVDGEWAPAKAIEEIDTPENEGAQTLSASGNILFFTACNRRGGFGSCDIYYSVFKNGKWSVPRNAGSDINTAYWEAQPSVSGDGRHLYFSSNRPGGK